jgi:hypothetical protein
MKYEVIKTVTTPYAYRVWDGDVLMCDCGDNALHAGRLCALLNDAWKAPLLHAALHAQLEETQRQLEQAHAAIRKALALHGRYCDRVGAADGWATAVHQALREALDG